MLSAAVVIGALKVKGHFCSSVPANEKLQDIKSKPKNSAQMVSTCFYQYTLSSQELCFRCWQWYQLPYSVKFSANPIALRVAKTPQSFGRSECNRLKVFCSMGKQEYRHALFTI